jgi:hypothetical protein
MNAARPPRFGAFAWLMIVVAGGIGALAAWNGLGEGPERWLRAYLVAWIFWTGISLGSLAIVLLHNLTGGAWGVAIRPIARPAAAALVPMGLLFLPIAFGVQHLYPWANSSVVAQEPILQHKQAYLNVTFFHLRAVAYFVVWFVLLLFMRWQANRPPADDVLAERRISRLSGQGLLLHGLAVTFSAIDWMMSLEPEWFSTIYGVLVFVSQGLAALAFCVFVYCVLATDFASQTERGAQHDLGKLLLAFVMLWTYMSLSQFLIIWYGNLPEEVVWYARRLHGGWQWLAYALVALHFILPFVLLLSRELKRNAAALGSVAGLLLAMNWCEKIWLIEPARREPAALLPWLDTGLLLLIGALWCLAFVIESRRDGLILSGRAEVRHG